MEKHVKMPLKITIFFWFLKEHTKKISGFFRFLEEHTKIFCAIRTYKRFLYVLIVNFPCIKIAFSTIFRPLKWRQVAAILNLCSVEAIQNFLLYHRQKKCFCVSLSKKKVAKFFMEPKKKVTFLNKI